jgi:LacI family transcriptional regulator
VGVLRARRAAGADLGLLGFDDFELAETLGLSVVAHEPEQMGAMAAELALRRMADPMGVVEQLVLPTRVVLRGSERSMR